jgi:hypothetical protein
MERVFLRSLLTYGSHSRVYPPLPALSYTLQQRHHGPAPPLLPRAPAPAVTMQVTDDIPKPERDSRLYRRITFPNGLEALLISDPSLVRHRRPIRAFSITNLTTARSPPAGRPRAAPALSPDIPMRRPLCDVVVPRSASYRRVGGRFGSDQLARATFTAAPPSYRALAASRPCRACPLTLAGRPPRRPSLPRGVPFPAHRLVPARRRRWVPPGPIIWRARVYRRPSVFPHCQHRPSHLARDECTRGSTRSARRAHAG